MKPGRNPRLILGAVFMAAAFLSIHLSQGAIAQAQSDSATFTPEPCWFDSPLPFFLPASELECGYVIAPLRHAEPDGETIRLPVAIMRATSEDRRPDPLFLAQGGPGGDAFEVFPIFLAGASFAADRDMVIFNQRGTRYAEPTLMCPETVDIKAQSLSADEDTSAELALQAVSDCYERLVNEGIDLSAFNSQENADDVEIIRQALGYETYNYYGVSYGTLLGLHLMRQNPDHLRSVILDGVVPAHLNFIPQIPTSTDRVFGAVIDACTSDSDCNETYPNLEDRFFALVNRLNVEPRRMTLRDDETGDRVEAILTGDQLVSVLFQSFYLPDGYAAFPKLVDNLENGDYTFVEHIWPLFAFDRTLSEGMYWSVVCAEDADFDPAQVPVDGLRPYFADGAVEDLSEYEEVCALWQVDRLPASIDDPVTSDVPALLMSGFYDPITPPSFAETAADALTGEHNYVHPTGSHGVAFDSPCTQSILEQFLKEPNSEPDVSCLDDVRPIPFIPPDVLSFGFLSELNRLSDSFMQQIAVGGVLLTGALTAFLILPLAGFISLLRKKPETDDVAVAKRSRGVMWAAVILILVFGLLAIIFVAGSTYYAFAAIFDGLANIFAISSASAPFFIIPFLLLALTVALLFMVVLAWRRGAWSTWLRIYMTFVLFCAAGYLFMLARAGVFSVLL